MKKVSDNELNEIYGGDSISGPIINAIVNVLNLIQEAGYNVGSGIRRIIEGEMCPLR